jgi:hypothetical protein
MLVANYEQRVSCTFQVINRDKYCYSLKQIMSKRNSRYAIRNFTIECVFYLAL